MINLEGTLPNDRVYEPVIDRHDAWIVVNGMQGCPKNCGYCYLKDRNQTLVKPVMVATPERTLQQLLDSPYYTPDAKLALYTCTDALATPRNRHHLTRLLDLMAQARLKNPVCLITKCAFTQDVLDCLVRVQIAGLKVIVFLSYSGLGPDVEKGIKHDELRNNFPALHAIGTPIIHYWRPLTPKNSTPEVIDRVLSLVTRYAECSVAIGLKVKPGAREQMLELWPELAAASEDLENAASVWPISMRKALTNLPFRYGDYPIYETNSCALAFVMGQPDRSNILDSAVCQRNHCPLFQRERCLSRPPLPTIDEQAIDAQLRRLDIDGTPYTLEVADRTVTFSRPIPSGHANTLAAALQVRVKTPKSDSDLYWPGKASAGKPLTIEG
ncbi:hypothetical protein [Streptomyces sp. NPDC001594]|uniref:hypothetical protein n=1 Tax=Streptomyces sp. NPDC001594 TaxID=3364590 RepID=UPI0036A4EC81